MQYRVLFPSFIWFLTLVSCGQPAQKTETAPPVSTENSEKPASAPDTLPRGVVIKQVTCLADPSTGYALYLPHTMKPGKKYPVVFFFDAQARGTMPLEKYKDIAERYSFIMACSNNSKNRMDAVTVGAITTGFFKDVLQRFPVDPKNIFTGGFSGGARVAIGVAIQDSRVKGVIANSAGFDPRQEPMRKEVCFVGLVGTEDFNLAELKSTQRELNTNGNTNDLLLFNGKHDWAPLNDMDKAFLLLWLEGIRAKRIEKNDSILNASYKTDQKEAEKILHGKENAIVQASACQLMDLYYTDLKPVDTYREAMKQITGGAAYKQATAREEEDGKNEQAQQDIYAREFREKDIAWWTQEVQRLNKEAQITKDKDKSTYHRRLLAYLSLVAFMNANAALNQQALSEAAHALTLYKLVDPTNSEWAYLSACLAMRQQDQTTALTNLDEAVKLGFNDLDRIRVQPEFQPLLNDNQFNELVAKIKPL